MTAPFRVIELELDGLGVILYSPFAVAQIHEGEDYLGEHFTAADEVNQHIEAGTLVGFGTGSPGTFKLHFLRGVPTEDELARHEFKLRLAIEIRDRTLCVRDLYDLMEWRVHCPEHQQLEVDDGFYRITVCSDVPESGVLGDDQAVFVYLDPSRELPRVRHEGVPILCT